MTPSTWRGSMPARSMATLPTPPTSRHGLVGPGEAACLDARALLDPLVGGVDGLDDLGVGHHPAGPVGADPEHAGVRRAGDAAARRGHPATPSRVEAEQRLAGGDEVAVVHEPLHDRAAVRRGDGGLLAQPRDGADGGPSGQHAALAHRGVLVEGALGRRDQQPPGGRGVERDGGAVLVDERAGVRRAGRGSCRAKVSTPFIARRAMPVRVPAGGISRMPVTPRSSIVSMHEVPADRAADLGDDPVEHVAAVVDDLAVAVGDHRGPRVVGRHRAGQGRQAVDGGRHVVGVEGAGDRQRHQPGAGRGVGGQRGELLHGAGRDDLARAVVVGRGQAVPLEGREHLVAVAAEDGGHARRRGGGGAGHRLAALAHQDHRLLGGERVGADGGGELADAVAGHRADLGERVRRVREESSAVTSAEATSSGWATAVSRIVSASALVPWWARSMSATAESQRSRSAKDGSARARARGNRGSGHPGRERR